MTKSSDKAARLSAHANEAAVSIPFPSTREELLPLIDQELVRLDDYLDFKENGRKKINELQTSSASAEFNAQNAITKTQNILDNSLLYKAAPIIGGIGGIATGAAAGAGAAIAAPGAAAAFALYHMLPLAPLSVILVPPVVGLLGILYSLTPVWGPVAATAGALAGSVYGSMHGPESVAQFIKNKIAPEHEKNQEELINAKDYVARTGRLREHFDLDQPTIDSAQTRSQALRALRDKVNNAFGMPVLSPAEARTIAEDLLLPEVVERRNPDDNSLTRHQIMALSHSRLTAPSVA